MQSVPELRKKKCNWTGHCLWCQWGVTALWATLHDCERKIVITKTGIIYSLNMLISKAKRYSMSLNHNTIFLLAFIHSFNHSIIHVLFPYTAICPHVLSVRRQQHQRINHWIAVLHMVFLSSMKTPFETFCKMPEWSKNKPSFELVLKSRYWKTMGSNCSSQTCSQRTQNGSQCSLAP